MGQKEREAARKAVKTKQAKYDRWPTSRGDHKPGTHKLHVGVKCITCGKPTQFGWDYCDATCLKNRPNK